MRPERPRPRPRRSGGRRPRASPPRGGDGRGGETPRRRTGSISQRPFFTAWPRKRPRRPRRRATHRRGQRRNTRNHGLGQPTAAGGGTPRTGGRSRPPRPPQPDPARRRKAPPGRTRAPRNDQQNPTATRPDQRQRQGGTAARGRGLRGRLSEDGARAATPSRGKPKTARERNAPKRRSAPGVSRACAACYKGFARLGATDAARNEAPGRELRGDAAGWRGGEQQAFSGRRSARKSRKKPTGSPRGALCAPRFAGWSAGLSPGATRGCCGSMLPGRQRFARTAKRRPHPRSGRRWPPRANRQVKTRDFPSVCSEKAAQRGERQRQSVGCGITEAACRRCAALCAAGRQAAAVVPGGARSAPVRWRAQRADTAAQPLSLQGETGAKKEAPHAFA